MQKKYDKPFLIVSALTGLCGLLVLGLISLSAVLSPAADDFCSLVSTREMGSGEYIDYYYSSLNGRFASGVVTEILYGSMSSIPFITLFLLSLSFIFIIYLLAPLRRFAIRQNYFLLLTSSALIVSFFFTASIAPHSAYQVFHWLPGIISYSLPILLSLLAWQCCLLSNRQSLKFIVIASVGFCLLATFQEFVGLMNASIAVALLFVKYWFKILYHIKTLLLLSIVTVSILGELVILFSPGAIARRASSISQDPLTQLKPAFYDLYAYVDSVVSIQGGTTLIMILLFGATLSLLLKDTYRNALRKWLNWQRVLAMTIVYVALLLAVTYGILLASRVAYNDVAPDRMLIYTQLLIVVGACLFGLLAGVSIKLGNKRSFAAIIPFVAIISVLVLCVVVLPGYTNLIGNRAAIYSHIETASKKSSHVTTLPLVKISGIGEPSLDQTYWVNGCIEEYYGIEKITPPNQ